MERGHHLNSGTIVHCLNDATATAVALTTALYRRRLNYNGIICIKFYAPYLKLEKESFVSYYVFLA